MKQQLRLLLGFTVLLFLFVLTGCVSVGETSQSFEMSREQQVERAKQFSRRMTALSPDKRLIFAVTSKIDIEQVDVVRQFADDMIGATLIFTGSPTYILEVDLKSQPILGDNNQQTYTVRFKDAHTKEVLSTGVSLVKCRPVKGSLRNVLLVFPPACRRVSAQGLAAALYSL